MSSGPATCQLEADTTQELLMNQALEEAQDSSKRCSLAEKVSAVLKVHATVVQLSHLKTYVAVL